MRHLLVIMMAGVEKEPTAVGGGRGGGAGG